MIRSPARVSLTFALLATIAQPARFRSGLTATVVSAPPVSGHACISVTLRWAPRDGARSYQVHVAPTHDGAWTSLPSTSVCGASRVLTVTSTVDPQPQPPPPATRRLFYRIVAIGPSGPIDSTDVVPVEIAPVAAARQP